MSATATVEAPQRTPAGVSPYKGLTPYGEEDASFFFGRESERRIIVANLVGSRLTLLYGESGVGKTSLLRAGVVPDLRSLAARNVEERGAPGHVVVVFSAWRDDPVDGLVQTVRAAVPDISAATSLDELLEGWTARTQGTLLLVLDQFEEFLLYHTHTGDTNRFAAQLTRAVNRRELRVHILIAIREDALAKLDRFKGQVPHVFENYLRLEHLDLAAARTAILKPLDRYNDGLPVSEHVSIEPELVDEVLDHVRAEHVDLASLGRGRSSGGDASERVETPYLQLVMQRLWNEERGTGSRVLRMETLARLGGPNQIVHKHLDEAMAALALEDRDVAAAIFHHLVTPSGTKIAHTATDLAGYVRLPEAQVARVLERLSRHDARILRPVPPPPDRPGLPRYEIFHDVLAPAILDWRARFAQERVRVAAKARERNLFRIATIVLAVIVVVLGALVALVVRQRDEAEQQRKLATSRELAVRSFTATNIDRQVELAEQAVHESPTIVAKLARDSALKNLDASLTITGALKPLTSASFTANGELVLTASEDHFARIVRASDKQGRGVFRTDTLVDAVAAPDGRHVITWGGDAAPVLWSHRRVLTRDRPRSRSGATNTTSSTSSSAGIAGWRQQRVLVEAGPVGAAAFAPDGSTFATAGGDGHIRMWQSDSGAPVTSFVAGGEGTWMMAFASRGERLVTVGADGVARIWELRTKKLGLKIGARGTVTAASFDPDGKLLVTAGSDGRARIWDTDRHQRTLLGTQGKPLNDARFSPDGEYVVTAGDDATARVFDASSGTEVAVFRKHTGPVRTAVFSTDGRVVLTAGADRTARFWHWSPTR